MFGHIIRAEDEELDLLKRTITLFRLIIIALARLMANLAVPPSYGFTDFLRIRRMTTPSSSFIIQHKRKKQT